MDFHAAGFFSMHHLASFPRALPRKRKRRYVGVLEESPLDHPRIVVPACDRLADDLQAQESFRRLTRNPTGCQRVVTVMFTVQPA
ncbi:hypothetical protein [Streptomyces goshikiensis]|uniref:hypothetical protein n=1 Tax=Streptomyces goshikiensis TaxID=1942 RepID=UPI003322278A